MTIWLPRLACKYPGIKPQKAPNKADPKIARAITTATGRIPPRLSATNPMPSPPIAA